MHFICALNSHKSNEETSFENINNKTTFFPIFPYVLEHLSAIRGCQFTDFDIKVMMGCMFQYFTEDKSDIKTA